MFEFAVNKISSSLQNVFAIAEEVRPTRGVGE